MKSDTKNIKSSEEELPNSWRLMSFVDISQLRKELYKPSEEEDLSYIGLEHINQGTLSINGIGNSSETISNKYYFHKDDVLFGKLRPYFRKVYKPNFEGVCSTDIWVLTPTQLVTPDYLFYFVANYDFVNLATEGSTGTRMPRANWSHIRDSKWPVPPLNEQHQIAFVLSSLDQKIELNRNMNKTLEEIGKALFKHWFVDFEFPNEDGEPYKSSGGEMVESELGEIPKGWEVIPLKGVVEKYVDNRGKTPPTVEQGIPLIEVKHLPTDGVFPITSTNKYVTQETFDTWFRAYLEPMDIVISTVGTIGCVNLIPHDVKLSIAQNVLGLRFKKEIVSQSYMFFVMRSRLFSEAVNARLVTTVQSSIKRKDLNTIPLLVPPREIVEQFDGIAENLIKLIEKNWFENMTLIQVRDKLLPRLMSGKIRVN